MTGKQQGIFVILLVLLGMIVLCCGLPMMLIDRREGVESNHPASSRPSAGGIAEVTAGANSWLDQEDVNQERIQSEEELKQVPAEVESASAFWTEDQGPFNTVPGSGFHVATTTAMRQWSTADGRFTTIAQLKALEKGLVQLEKRAGGRASVQLSKLSQADYEYVCGIVQINPSAHVVIGFVQNIGMMRDKFGFEDVFGTGYTVNLSGLVLPSSITEEGAELYRRYLDRVDGKHGWLEYEKTDERGRVLASLFVDGRNVNLDLIAQGIAWHDENEDDNPRLANAEYIAKSDGIGVWAKDLERPDE